MLTAVSDIQLQATTITVGNQATAITITPSIGQSVELQCEEVNSEIRFKQWYTTGREVMRTPCDISTRSGATRILAFSSFTPSHAGTYSCLASIRGATPTTTTYSVILGELLSFLFICGL